MIFVVDVVTLVLTIGWLLFVGLFVYWWNH
jgi:hypothetical protein